MKTTHFARTIASAAALFFGGLAIAVWAAPDLAARHLGVEALGVAGTAMLRAEVGGLFAGLAALCGTAAWTSGRHWMIAATMMLLAVMSGRAVGWASAGRVGGDAAEMVVELVLVTALFAAARRATAPPAGSATANRGAHRWSRPAIVATVLLAVPVGVAAALLSPGVQQRVYDVGAGRLAATINASPLEDDALRVAVCGSSAPLPSATRAKACVAVFAGGKFYVVDAGPESVENLLLWGIPMGSVGGVLLTHFHSDHIGDLGELNLQTWVGGRPGPLDVYGGPGIERVVAGFSEAYRLDQGYRTAHHTDRVMPAATWPMVAHTIGFEGSPAPATSRTTVVLQDEDLRITAVEVDHFPIAPAYAYRFDYKGRSAFVTGDLKYHPSLAEAAQGVDLLLSEAIAVRMTRALGAGASSAGRDRTAAVMHDIEDYHITPEQAAEVANGAGARLLAFYHLLPAPDGALARGVFGRGVDEVRDGNWTIAEDGSLFTMPTGSDTVRIGHVDR